MNNQSMIEQLEQVNLLKGLKKLQDRFEADVCHTYMKNPSLGKERLDAWERAAKKFLNDELPGHYQKLSKKLRPNVFSVGPDAFQNFLDNEYAAVNSFIDSLILDIQNNEHIIFDISSNKVTSSVAEKVTSNNAEDKVKIIEENKKINQLRKAFIVHGHDDATKERTARFLEKLGFSAVILHEQASSGKTIIEKLEHFTDVEFGIVLYTPDDEGSVKDKKDYKPRARQNVVFEHGLLIGKLGREKVFPLVTDHSVELPGDISGMVYLSDRGWDIQLAREIKAIGLEVDINKLI